MPEELTPDQTPVDSSDTPTTKATPEDVRGGSSSKSQKFSSDTPTMAEIRARKKPNRRTVAILLDSALSHEIDEKIAEIEKLERKQKVKGFGGTLADKTNQDLLTKIDELEELEESAAAETVEFTFQDIGRRAYDELLKEHRPTAEEKAEYKEAGGEGVLAYSTTTFPPTLISRCSVTPEISQEDAEAIFLEWSEGDLETIFMAALLACKEPTSLPKSRAGTAKTRVLQQNSTTAQNEESPTLDS
jgi:hypothetical protein